MALVGAGLLVAGLAARVRADDHVTVRGVYFREASTRVIQPVVEIAKDAPGGVDINAHYLLDAITSASVAAGTTTDSIFTETRNEVGFMVGKTIDWTHVALSYRYSAESDYWSHGVFLSAEQRLWGDTGTLAAYAGTLFDQVSARTRTPDCLKPGETTCSLNTYTGGLSYTQVLSPTSIAQVGSDLIREVGFQASPYRSVPGLGYEHVPNERNRAAVSLRFAHYFPSAGNGWQLHFRYYYDSWAVEAHMIEGRVYQRLTRDLEVRLSYRHYTQTPADFWCDWMMQPGCYGQSPVSYTSDPKLSPVRTEMPEVKLIWDADRLRGVPFLGWFAVGTFSASYARYFQNTPFGNAHLLQVGYTMPY
jgi:hypothetical protein